MAFAVRPAAGPIQRAPTHNRFKIRTLTKAHVMQRSQDGFTLVEITVVLVLMAIIAAYVIGRSGSTEQIDLVGQTDKIRNHIRYAQAAAMKQSNRIWGFKSDTGTNRYWLFAVPTPVAAGDEDQVANQLTLPGETNTIISFAGLGIDDITPSFRLFFDRIGRPYTTYIDEGASGNVALGGDLVITVSADGQTRALRVSPETGLVQ